MLAMKKCGEGSDSSNDSSEEDCDTDEAEKPMKTFVEWIKDATNISCDLMMKGNGTDWVEGQRDRQWGMAGRTARRRWEMDTGGDDMESRRQKRAEGKMGR